MTLQDKVSKMIFMQLLEPFNVFKSQAENSYKKMMTCVAQMRDKKKAPVAGAQATAGSRGLGASGGKGKGA